MVCCSAGDADQAADRRAVDDGAASLLAHLAQLVLHAAPHAAEIDRIHAIEFFAARIRSFHCRRLHAGVVERRVQPSEGGDGLFGHFRLFSFVSDIAMDGYRPATGRHQFLCCKANRIPLNICQRDCSSRLGEGPGHRQTHP